jgi:hypothetical protein
MVRPGLFPPEVAATSRLKILSLHDELGQSRDAISDAPRLIGR